MRESAIATIMLTATFLFMAGLQFQPAFGQELGNMSLVFSKTPATLDPSNPTLDITIHVSDMMTYQDIPGATVTITSDPAGTFVPSSGITGTDGKVNFVFQCEAALLQGRQWAYFYPHVEAAGYNDLTTGNVSVRVEAPPIRNMRIELSAEPDEISETQLASEISVSVTDRDAGFPVPGASVTLSSDAGGLFSEPSGTTDVNGAFESRLSFDSLPGVHSVTMTATVSVSGYDSDYNSVIISVVADDSQPIPDESDWGAIQNLAVTRNGAMGGVLNGRLYVIGGSDGSSALTSIEIYNPASGNWTDGTPMPGPRAWGACVAYGERLYVFGGTTSSGPANGAYCTDSLAYYPTSGTWSTFAGPDVDRGGCAAALLDGKAYIIGGSTGAGEYLDRVDVYDFQNNRWTAGPPIPIKLAHMAAGTAEGIILVGGGETEGGKGSDVILSLDPEEGVWRTYDFRHVGIGRCSGFARGGSLYMLGAGDGRDRAYSFSAPFYTESGTLCDLGALPEGRGHALSLEHNGVAYVIAGEDADSGQVLRTSVSANLNEMLAVMEYSVYVPREPFTVFSLTFVFLVAGLAADGTLAWVAYGRSQRKFAEMRRMREKPIMTMASQGAGGFVHARPDDIVGRWREHVLANPGCGYFFPESLLRNAEIASSAETVAARAECLKMYERHDSETAYRTMQGEIVIHTDPKPKMPAEIVNERQEYPTSRKIVKCGICKGAIKITCPLCKGETKIVCDKCFGDGKVMCQLCRGTGQGVCSSCGGSGSQTCRSCGGSGNAKVLNFRGTGLIEDSTITCKTCNGRGTTNCSVCRGVGRAGACRGCSRGYLPCEKCDETGKLTCHKCSGQGKIVCENCIGYGQVFEVEMEVWTYKKEEMSEIKGPERLDLSTGDFFGPNSHALKLNEVRDFIAARKDPDSHITKATEEAEKYAASKPEGLVRKECRINVTPVTCCEMSHGGKKFKIWGIGGPASCRVVAQGLPERKTSVLARRAAPIAAGIAFALCWVYILYFM